MRGRGTANGPRFFWPVAHEWRPPADAALHETHHIVFLLHPMAFRVVRLCSCEYCGGSWPLVPFAAVAGRTLLNTASCACACAAVAIILSKRTAAAIFTAKLIADSMPCCCAACCLCAAAPCGAPAALGFQSGALADGQFSASGSYPLAYWSPRCARLNVNTVSCRGWCGARSLAFRARQRGLCADQPSVARVRVCAGLLALCRLRCPARSPIWM